MFEKVRKVKTYQAVAEQIEDRIKTGLLKVGDTLPPEAELAAEFGVGRASVREALRMLESLGMVETHVTKGTVVISDRAVNSGKEWFRELCESQHLRSVLEARRAVDPAIAELAAERRTEEELQEMATALRKMKDNLDNPNLAQKFAGEFHSWVSIAAKNQILSEFKEVIADVLQKTTETIYEDVSRRSASYSEHMEILEQIANRDARGAYDAMLRHLRAVELSLARKGALSGPGLGHEEEG